MALPVGFTAIRLRLHPSAASARRLGWLLGSTAAPLIILAALAAFSRPAAGLANSPTVIISEVAWSGTAASGNDEWLELYNSGDAPVDLTGWRITIDDLVYIPLAGSIAPAGFYLLERNNDETISDIPADIVYDDLLIMVNGGAALALLDAQQVVVDTANGDGGPWPAGTADGDYRSMERVAPDIPDGDDAWISNDGVHRNGHDANGDPVNGTPRQHNGPWPEPGAAADLSLAKSGPEYAAPGQWISYTLAFSNVGELAATGVVLTDTLPEELAYESHNAPYPVSQPVPGTLVWQVGPIGPGIQVSFALTAVVAANASGTVTNQAWISTPVSETTLLNNSAAAATLIVGGELPPVLIDAVYYDAYESGEPDEAVRLLSLAAEPLEVGGWALGDGLSRAYLPAGAVLAPGEAIWLAKDALAFRRQFGFSPAYEVAGSDPAVPDLTGVWPGFSNSGDEVLLLDVAGLLIDAVVYEEGDTTQSGWIGAAVQPYQVTSVFAAEGQILYRRRDPATGLPVPDTNSESDWAQTRGDILNGRKVRYPGWDFDPLFFTQLLTETAQITIAIAPDNAYETLVAQLDAAASSIRITTLTFRNVAVADALIRARQRGVAVTVLLEGGPAGGIDDQERYVCQQLEAAGGQCWFMINDPATYIFDRYGYLHAKIILIDGVKAVISSENLSPDSLPADDKSDGTWGRRGLVLITNAPGVVSRLEEIWSYDFAPAAHADLFRWAAGHPVYGNPPPGTVPITVTGGTTYTVRFPAPLVVSGAFPFELVQSPENSLRESDGLLGLIAQAGDGDLILAEQLAEPPHWGPSSSNAAADPNPRLEALLDAARRGARVRLLLDGYFDDGLDATSNRATCQTVNDLSGQEGIDVRCALGNPTGLGLHNKMILARIGGQGYVHLGSLNGTELSHKGNREVAIQFRSAAAFDLLARMFTGDWPHRSLLPLARSNYRGRADHVLISEVLYDPPGADDAEFVELVNPTYNAVNLSGFALSDAVYPADFEDARIFPPGTVLAPGATLVVATTATAFAGRYAFNPDFEILESDPAVPNLIDDPAWGDPAATLQFGNLGDEVILRGSAGHIVDALAYGAGLIPGLPSCALLSQFDHSLERFPYWRDADNCPADFRDWPYPNPRSLP